MTVKLLTITAALLTLSAAVDSEWTSGGAPAMANLIELTGDDKLTRATVTGLVPDLTRDALEAFEKSEDDEARDPRVVQSDDDSGNGSDNQKPGSSNKTDLSEEELALLDEGLAGDFDPFRDFGIAPELKTEAEVASMDADDVEEYLAELKEELEARRDERAKLKDHITAANDAVKAADGHIETMMNALERAGPTVNLADLVKASHAQSQGDAVKRADLVAKVLEGKGLDASMARRKGFGRMRPDFNPSAKKD